MGERDSGLHRSVAATVAAAAGLLGVFMLQGALAIAHHAPTYDEAAHLASGYSMLATGDFRLNPQVPPLVKILLASPLYLGSRLAFTPDPAQWRDAADYPIGQAFLYGSARPADEILATGRFANLALGAGLVVLIGWWAGRLWGRAAAVVAIALAALEPNLVAHSSLVTTDVGATLFMVLTLYLLWEATSAKSSARWLATGLSAGLAMAAKYSTLTLIPILGAILARHVLLGGIIKDAPWALPAAASPRRQRLIQAVSVIPLLGVPATLVVLAAYFFQGLHPWWFGLLRFLEQANAGQPAYFLGHYSHAGWWTYFPVSFLIKTPVATLVVIAASLTLCRMGAPLLRRDAIFLLAPVGVVFLVSAQVKTNIGLRHILVVYPLLFVLASRVATFSPRRVWLVPVLAGSAIAATAASTLPVTPHQLAYFNELVGGPEHGHRYLSDSNIDWGQDLRGVKGFMDQQGIPIAYLSYFGSAPPAYYGIRYQYVPGSWPLEWPPPRAVVPATLARKVLIISVSNLQGVHTHFTSLDLFAWLRTRRPIARIGYSILVYDLSGDAEALGALAETYRRMGLAAIPDAQPIDAPPRMDPR
jgi:4-amino-4-deoxy-L-arabinose transferase-like glycosyltransferase